MANDCKPTCASRCDEHPELIGVGCDHTSHACDCGAASPEPVAADIDPLIRASDGQDWRKCSRCGALYPPGKACLNDTFHKHHDCACGADAAAMMRPKRAEGPDL